MPVLKILSKTGAGLSCFLFFKEQPERFCHGCCVREFTAGDTEAACVKSYQTDLFSVLLGIRKSGGKP